MDQIEAVAKLLESCARLVRRMAGDGSADVGEALTAASSQMEETAKALMDVAKIHQSGLPN